MRYLKTAATIGISLCFFTFIGCVRFHSQTISATQSLTELEARTLDNPELKKFIEQNFTQEIS